MSRNSTKNRKPKAIKKDVVGANKRKKGTPLAVLKKTLSPVDEGEELPTETVLKQPENKRPTRRVAKKTSYEEVGDADTEPESSDDEPKHKNIALKKATASRKTTSPKTQARSKRPTPIKTGLSGIKSSPLRVGLSPANITQNMWKSNESDWRVPDAMDY
jgi:hypothetical protein